MNRRARILSENIDLCDKLLGTYKKDIEQIRVYNWQKECVKQLAQIPATWTGADEWAIMRANRVFTY
jgi:hypothetical protein